MTSCKECGAAAETKVYLAGCYENGEAEEWCAGDLCRTCITSLLDRVNDDGFWRAVQDELIDLQRRAGDTPADLEAYKWFEDVTGAC